MGLAQGSDLPRSVAGTRISSPWVAVIPHTWICTNDHNYIINDLPNISALSTPTTGEFGVVFQSSIAGFVFGIQFYKDVADRSPIPLIIYNYPGACGGLDLNSDTITEISKHQNIVGVKLTCGNTGKLARVRANASAPFLTMGGSADFTLQMAAVGGHGPCHDRDRARRGSG